MSDCDLLKACPFFNDRMQSMPASAHWLKIRYCRDRFEDCARYQAAQVLGPKSVPADLFPTQTPRAQALIASPASPTDSVQPGPNGSSPDKPLTPR